MISIGVIGYSAQKFDQNLAEGLLKEYLSWMTSIHGRTNIELVSGLTDLGIPRIAYQVAKSLGLRTVGIACSKARDYNCWPVDEELIIGDDWGDESKTFLDRITHMVKCGGGKQSETEAKEFLAKWGSRRFKNLPLDVVI